MVANLKELRQKCGYSQKALADKLGITQQAIYKYENLSVEPDIQTLIAIADIFNVTVDYLIGRESESVVSQITITADEAAHLSIWRTLPAPLRGELDSIIQRYDVIPAGLKKVGGN